MLARMDVPIPLARGIAQSTTFADEGAAVFPSRRALCVLCNALLASGHGADAGREGTELRRLAAVAVDFAVDAHPPGAARSFSVLRDASQRMGLALAADRLAHFEERVAAIIRGLRRPEPEPRGAGDGGGAVVPVEPQRGGAEQPRHGARAGAIVPVHVGRTATNPRFGQTNRALAREKGKAQRWRTRALAA
ncbi:unnamed protein product [Prorocentrum cordatum]|uniref:Uncharacterized protein n=1 Tax=Prorocentrum cordatum TaxID=2364126 RepID=A0ABN9WNA7_9DINO|nr:unnamed protein product [Polarella glacialis]